MIKFSLRVKGLSYISYKLYRINHIMVHRLTELSPTNSGVKTGGSGYLGQSLDHSELNADPCTQTQPYPQRDGLLTELSPLDGSGVYIPVFLI